MFRFRLEKVRRWRRRLEDAEARAHRRAQEELRRARREVRRQQELLADLERQPEPGEDVQFLILRSAWRERLHRELDRLRQAEAAAAAAVERRRRDLIEAHRRREVLERLARSERERWEREQARRERKDLDEVAGNRAARRPRPELP